MTIDEAIKTLTFMVQGGDFEGKPDQANAVRLGKEALQAIRTGREDFYEAGGNLLPGEAKNYEKEYRPTRLQEEEDI